MVDTQLLRSKMEESGYKYRFIADKVGLTYQGLLNKINGRNEFTASEIARLSEVLNLDSGARDEIFFNRGVAKTDT